MKKISLFGCGLLVMIATLQSCKKTGETSTETEVQTEEFNNTAGTDTLPVTDEGLGGANGSSGSNAGSAQGNEQTDNTGNAKSATPNPTGTNGDDVESNGVDPYYNGRGTKSGSKSGVHTGSGNNAGQGSSTGTGTTGNSSNTP